VSEFVVDFLPSEFRRRGVMAASRRRSVLLLGLLGAMVVGVAAHSWNRSREAESRRAVSLALTTSASKVDDVVDRLAEQQRELHRYLSVYDRLALPVEQSDLVATITHLMPERTSLSMLRLEVKDDSAANAADAAKERPAKATAAGKAVAKATTRWMEVTISGYAAGNADLYELERKLANTKPFDAVTVSENKPIDVPGSHVQEFKVTCRVPLDVKYVRPGTTVAAGTNEASR
jgi:Tfp pilus assembly protein PilN